MGQGTGSLWVLRAAPYALGELTGILVLWRNDMLRKLQNKIILYNYAQTQNRKVKDLTEDEIELCLYEYYKNKMRYRMNHLPGRIGREIIDEIRNTPAPDYTQLNKEADEFAEKMLERRKNGG